MALRWHSADLRISNRMVTPSLDGTQRSAIRRDHGQEERGRLGRNRNERGGPRFPTCFGVLVMMTDSSTPFCIDVTRFEDGTVLFCLVNGQTHETVHYAGPTTRFLPPPWMVALRDQYNLDSVTSAIAQIAA